MHNTQLRVEKMCPERVIAKITAAYKKTLPFGNKKVRQVFVYASGNHAHFTVYSSEQLGCDLKHVLGLSFYRAITLSPDMV